jgi:drug/metabolite transporter (DMT)-like permease
MVRLVSILLVGLVLEAIGVVFLNKGLKEIGSPETWSPAALIGFAAKSAVNPRLAVGVAFEAGFFGCLLFLMSHGDVSFIWPLTSLGFVLTTLAAHFILKEAVSPMRWLGVALIVAGAGIITMTEKAKESSKAAAESPVR